MFSVYSELIERSTLGFAFDYKGFRGLFWEVKMVVDGLVKCLDTFGVLFCSIQDFGR